MANISLGKDSVREIRQKMSGLAGSTARAEAVRLAADFDISVQYVYELTEDLRPKRKTRADKGKRQYELKPGTDVWYAAELVIGGLDPDQALLTAQTRGFIDLPSLEYFRQMLAEHLGTKRQRTQGRRSHRRWEAESPGEMVHIDVTALKVRWEDKKTRRILKIEGIDKNHPQTDTGKLKVWQVMAVDDHSRRHFLRYVATPTSITSRDIIKFVCELFDHWGVPQTIYTDNGSEFKGYFNRAERLLNKILDADGGFRHQRHMPNNPQASGKVEVAHKWAEKMDAYIGLAVEEGRKVEFEHLNPFADEICEWYNAERIHRTTGQTPDARWFGKRVLVRKLPREVIESALLSDERDLVLRADCTIEHNKKVYQLPTKRPFVDFVGQKLSVVIPHAVEWLLVRLPDGAEYEIEKVLFNADRAGDWKSNESSRAEELKNQLKESRKERVAGIREASKQMGTIAPVPALDVPLPRTASNRLDFPHPERVVSAEEVTAVAPVPQAAASGKLLGYWEALARFKDKFPTMDEAKEFFDKLLGPDGQMLSTEISEAISKPKERPNLRAVG